MIKIFGHIRQRYISGGITKKYVLYTIGEIVLVVIGILIALQINNWNEDKSVEKQLYTNIISIKEDIQEESILLNTIINTLDNQEQASLHIISIMESKNKIINDSLTFIIDFHSFATTPILVGRNNT